MSTESNDYEPRFERLEGAEQDRLDEFLQEHVLFTAREWALARLCADFRTATGVEMTKLGQSLPELVPWMDQTYTPQAVYAARQDFDAKVRRAMKTALYGAMADFYTADELDDVMYESTEAAKLLLEAEGVGVDVESEMHAEESVRTAMQEINRRSEELRHDEPECPHCGEDLLEMSRETEPVDVEVPDGLKEWKEEFRALGE